MTRSRRASIVTAATALFAAAFALAFAASPRSAAAPDVSAKFKLSLAVSDSTPAVRQRVTAVVRSERDLDYELKLIAVAPGKSWYDVVGVVTGDSNLAKAKIPHDGFAIRLVRKAANRWQGVVSFPRAGRWRLIVPNGAAEGFMIPPPVVRPVMVR